jgi:hypothetical protein
LVKKVKDSYWTPEGILYHLGRQLWHMFVQ